MLIYDLFVWVVVLGVWYFGNTLCTQTWYQSFYEESLSILIKIWNRCCQNFERVSGSRFFVHLWPMGAVALRPERHFHWEIVFVSLKIVSVCSRNTHFDEFEGKESKHEERERRVKKERKLHELLIIDQLAKDPLCSLNRDHRPIGC